MDCCLRLLLPITRTIHPSIHPSIHPHTLHDPKIRCTYKLQASPSAFPAPPLYCNIHGSDWTPPHTQWYLIHPPDRHPLSLFCDFSAAAAAAADSHHDQHISPWPIVPDAMNHAWFPSSYMLCSGVHVECSRTVPSAVQDTSSPCNPTLYGKVPLALENTYHKELLLLWVSSLETSVALALSFSVCVVICSLLGTEVVQVSLFFCTPVSDLSFGRNTVLLNVCLPFGLEDDDAVRSES